MTTRLPAVLASLVLLAGCTGSSPSDERGVRGRLTVLAASSLTDVFTVLGRRYEAQHPGADVRFSFAASSELATQVVAGAPADVYAAANPDTMAQVVAAGAATGRPALLARNRLQVVVPAGNPGRVRGLADLARAELDVALCAPEVPCGAASRDLLAAAGVTASVDTLEPDVRAVLTKVELGEVDAALVYRSDVLAAGEDVEGVDVPESPAAVNDYLVTVLRDAPNAAAARAFVALALSPAGQKVLAAAGFEVP